jgi:hypothetical protein
MISSAGSIGRSITIRKSLRPSSKKPITSARITMFSSSAASAELFGRPGRDRSHQWRPSEPEASDHLVGPDLRSDLFGAAPRLSQRQEIRRQRHLQERHHDRNLGLVPLLREMLEKRDGVAAARKAIIATTDKAKGALYTLAVKEGYVRFVIPDDIGGRYSVQTAVGLFPIACAGIDPREILAAALPPRRLRRSVFGNQPSLSLRRDPPRNVRPLPQSRRNVHHLRPGLRPDRRMVETALWRSEGKDKKGLLPDSATFTTDLHSLGQFIQDGTRSSLRPRSTSRTTATTSKSRTMRRISMASTISRAGA